MLKILNTQQIKALDSYTIEQEPISSIDLMERACHAFVVWFTKKFSPDERVNIVCGTGNNGGDGLGIARLLHEWNYLVKVWVIKGGHESEDFKLNLQRLNNKIQVIEITSDSDSLTFDGKVLIDAIFGSGLSRPVEGIYQKVIQRINQSNALRVAVDIPSGLMADKSSIGEIVQAHYTVSFQLPKLAFLMPQNFLFVGEWLVVSIGLKKEFIRQADSNSFIIQKKDVKKILKPRFKFDHKGNYGKALLIAGSKGKMGAAILAARSALRAGIGLLTVHVPKIGYEIIQTSVPEAMTNVDDSVDIFSTLPSGFEYDTIGVGPGLGTAQETVTALERTMKEFNRPMVLDADALNMISTNQKLQSVIPVGSILTPHPKEFERLAGKWENDFHRLQLQIEFATKMKCTIVLKGAHTSVATPEGKMYFNTSGNPGMATGGSGDVLTGMITSFLAQGYPAEQAAILGVYMHGLAGDKAAMNLGMEALIASDIIDHISSAFRSVQ